MAQTTRCSRNNALVGLVILLMCFTQVQKLITFQFGEGMQLNNSLSVPDEDASNEVSSLLVSQEKNLSSNAHHDTNPQELVEEHPAPSTLLQNQNTAVTWCGTSVFPTWSGWKLFDKVHPSSHQRKRLWSCGTSHSLLYALHEQTRLYGSVIVSSTLCRQSRKV